MALKIKHTKYNTQGSYYHLTNDHFMLDADCRTGILKGLYLSGDELGTNFLGNELNFKINVWWKQRYIPEKSQRTPMYCWTGDMLLQTKKEGESDWTAMHSCVSDDIRKISCDENCLSIEYDGNSENPGGFHGLQIKQSFALENDAIAWKLNVKNTTNSDTEIGELGLPISLNTNCSIGGEQDGVNHRGVDSLKYIFEQRVAGHSFVSGHSSHIDIERVRGEGERLVLFPTGDTSLEAVYGEYYQGAFLETDMVRVKSPVFYLHSKATAKKPWINGHSSWTLRAGEQKQYAFRIVKACDDSGVDEKLYNNGKVVFKIAPGLVLPIGATGHVLLKCRKPIHSVRAIDGSGDRAGGSPGENAGADIESVNSLGDRYVYKVTLKSEGEHKIRIEYGDGEWTHILFYGLSPIETLIKSRAAHSSANQQILDPDDIRQYGFTYWNNTEDRLVVRNEIPDCSNGCGNDQGLEAPLFLIEKNVYYPEQNELEVIDNFIEKCLIEKLQDQNTYTVLSCLFGPQEGTWRRWNYSYRYYDYPHVYNMYYAMYLIQKRHPWAEISRSADEYLRLAYNTARAAYADSTYEEIFHAKNFSDYHVGNMSNTHGAMGSWNIYNLLDELKKVGLTQEYELLKKDIEGSWPFFLEEEYPYATEFLYDSPSFPAVYYTGKAAASESLMQKTINIIMANRHKFPFWFSYGVDLKTIGNYTTPLGARALLDSFERTGNQLHLRIGYAATLGIWSCVTGEGRGFGSREWRFNMPKACEETAYFSEHYSGEIGMGLHGNLSVLKAYLVQDDDFGAIGYGCEVEETEEAYTLEPWDGLGVRAAFMPLGLEIETVKAKIVRATAAYDGKSLEIDLEKPFAKAGEARVTISGLSPGKYRVRGSASHGGRGGRGGHGGRDAEMILESDGWLELPIEIGASCTVVIEQVK